MQQSETIRRLGLTLVLLACFTSATARYSWSQSEPSSMAQPEVKTDSSVAGTESAAASPELTIGGGDLLKVSVLGAPESDARRHQLAWLADEQTGCGSSAPAAGAECPVRLQTRAPR